MSMQTKGTGPGFISRFILSPLQFILLFISLIGVPFALAYSCYGLSLSLSKHRPDSFDGALKSVDTLMNTLNDTREKLDRTAKGLEALEAQAKTLSDGE